MSDGSNGNSEPKLPPTILGWIVRLVSLGSIAILFAVLAWEMTRADEDVAFRVELKRDSAYVAQERHFMPIEITNQGSSTARAVKMDVAVNGESRSIEIDMIGQNETVKFTLSSAEPIEMVEHMIMSYESG